MTLRRILETGGAAEGACMTDRSAFFVVGPIMATILGLRLQAVHMNPWVNWVHVQMQTDKGIQGLGNLSVRRSTGLTYLTLAKPFSGRSIFGGIAELKRGWHIEIKTILVKIVHSTNVMCLVAMYLPKPRMDGEGHLQCLLIPRSLLLRIARAHSSCHRSDQVVASRFRRAA